MTDSAGSRRYMVWITFIIALLQMLAPFSIDAYLPSFPDISRDLSASPVLMQQTISFYMAGFAIMNLFYGSISDAYGRRSVVLVALSGYAIISIACALTEDIHTLLWLRAGQGIFAAAGVVIGRAMVRDLFEGSRAQKVMSHSMTWFAMAPALAPVIGGWLHTAFGWRSVFWFLALFAVGLILLVATRINEPLPREHRQPLHPMYLLRMYGQALRKGRFLSIVVGNAIFFAGFFLYITSAPTMIYEHLHLGANDFIYLFGPLVGGMIIGAQLSGRLAGRWPQERSIALGITLMLAGAALNLAQAMYMSPGVVNTIGPVALYVTGMALNMPVLSIMAIDCFPNNRGLASSMQGFLQMGTNALVAGLVVPLLYHSVEHLAFGMAVFFIVGYVIFRLGVRRLDPPGGSRENA
jgi:DHA1 family bicyclomycin/chloramphenicol resistance-like MFS transporter